MTQQYNYRAACRPDLLLSSDQIAQFYNQIVPLTLSAPNFRLLLSSALIFNKLLIRIKFIYKAERLNVK